MIIVLDVIDLRICLFFGVLETGLCLTGVASHPLISWFWAERFRVLPFRAQHDLPRLEVCE